MSEPRKLKRAVIKEEFIALTGDLVSAVFLNQLLYWTERVKDVDAYIVEEKARGKGADIELNHGWIYKKADELIAETMVTISESTARRRLEDLTKLGIIECRTNPNNKWDKVLQYRVNLVELSTALFRFGYPLSGYSLPDDLVGYRKRQFDASRNHPESTEKQFEVSALHGEAAIPEITTKITTKITGGDHTILDQPAPSAAPIPPPSALPTQPQKVEQPKPIVGGSAKASNNQPVKPMNQARPNGHLPINGYNHRQAGDQGIDSLVYARSNGGSQKIREQEQAEIYTSEMKALGVDPVEFRKMVDALLTATEKAGAVKLDNERSIKLLNDHKAAIRDIAKAWATFRTEQDVKAVVENFFAKNKNFAGSAIHLSQFNDHAGKMAAEVDKPVAPATTSSKTSGEPVVSAYSEEYYEVLTMLKTFSTLHPAGPKTENHYAFLARRTAYNAANPERPIPLPEKWKHLEAAAA